MTKAIVWSELKQLPSRTLAYVRNEGPFMGDSDLFARHFAKVGDRVGSKRLDDRSRYASHFGLSWRPRNGAGVWTTHKCGVHRSVRNRRCWWHSDIRDPFWTIYCWLIRNISEWICKSLGRSNELHRLTRHIPTGMIYESYKNDLNEHREGEHLVDICVGVQN